MPKSKLLSDREILIGYRNTWQSKLIAASIDQKHAEKTEAENPNFIDTRMTETGQMISMPIKDVIENKKESKARHLLFVNVIDTLLKMESKGLLDELWSPEALKPAEPKIAQPQK